MRPRQRYPARKPKGKPIKAAIARSNILVPGTILELDRYSYSRLVYCGRLAAAPYCRASQRGASVPRSLPKGWPCENLFRGI
jgi:hypothetical protein